MMTTSETLPFLELLSKYLLTTFKPAELKGVKIILPSRRARLFLKNYLVQHTAESFISPAFYSIEEYVFELAGLKQVDSTELLFMLYAEYKEVETEKPQSFDEFSGWANVLLSDFNEIDSYYSDTRQLFDYLNEDRALQVWSPDRTEISDFQKKYLKFWRMLGVLYQRLTAKLLLEKKAYAGLAYRYATDQIINNAHQVSDDRIIFAGFNALNGCEEIIFRYLKEHQKAEIIFDADLYYISNRNQEAGIPLRRHLKKDFYSKTNGNLNWTFDNFKNVPKKIHILSATRNVSQARLAASILDDSYEEGTNKWCLVLADESLLIPAINSLPEKVQDANISMGYPLKVSPLFSFVISYINLYNSVKSFSDGHRFFSRYFLDFITHPEFAKLAPDSSLVNILKEKIVKKSLVFLSYQEVLNLLEPAQLKEFSSLLLPRSHKNNVLPLLEDCLKLIRLTGETNIQDDILYSFSLEFARLINHLFLQMGNYNIEMSVSQLKNLLFQLSGSVTIPFYGEPLKGLQITGMLETRNLDFENVIITSVNEGILPAGKKQNSFIPYEVKKIFSLPTYSDKDSIFAYHFYRLISRAQNVYLIYNEDTDGIGGAEPSRFITQLKNELAMYSAAVEIVQEIVQTPLKESVPGARLTVVPKSQEILDLTLAKFKRGLSPSSLNLYRDCSLKFYFSEIAGIKEETEVEEDIDAALFGTILHQVLEHYFSPLKNLILTPDLLITDGVKKLSIQSFEDNYGKNKLSGKNLILFEVLLKLVEDYLKVFSLEVKNNAISIKELEYTMLLEKEVEGHTVKFKGNADRLDSLGKAFRILDYKTGNVENKELTLKAIEDLYEGEFSKAFQLLFYSWQFWNLNPGVTSINASIVSFRKLREGNINLSVNGSTELDTNLLKEFEKYLFTLLAEIVDVNIDFKQTTEVKRCEYCLYKEACNR